MDIHRPKAAHTWGEFLIEIGTIICGIVIALGLEQVVEVVRTDSQARQIEVSLRDAIQTNLLWASERIAMRACLQQRIKGLGERLEAAGDTWSPDPQTYAHPEKVDTPWLLPTAFRSPGREWDWAPWRAALANPAFNDLSQRERAEYAQAFGKVERLQADQDQEKQNADDISSLAFAHHMTPELRARYLDRLGAVARDVLIIDVISSQLLEDAHRMNLHADAAKLQALIGKQRAVRGDCIRAVGS